MRILYVDDEPLAIQKFELILSQLTGITDCHTCLLAEEALAYAGENLVDAAFLDIQLPGMNGLELAKALHGLNKNLHVFFVTAHDQYALEAFGVDALGYLLKPYGKDALGKAIDKARRMRCVPEKAVYVQTIPNFDVYINGELLPISSPKPKELLALLVDRNGGAVSSRQAISLLWENRPDDEKTKALYRMTCKRLREILTHSGIGFILSAEGPLKFIRPDTFACDYFRFLSGDQETMAKYNGQYMAEYSWAEETNARLTNLKDSRKEVSRRISLK
ncbi:MAG: response regulator [Clostridiales bacterium]|nr:response regulator [Clostridiales bacterium]